MTIYRSGFMACSGHLGKREEDSANPELILSKLIRTLQSLLPCPVKHCSSIRLRFEW